VGGYFAVKLRLASSQFKNCLKAVPVPLLLPYIGLERNLILRKQATEPDLIPDFLYFRFRVLTSYCWPRN
jgi:hypothetical protein